MTELIFNVKFLSDIILQASSNNEGKIAHHDFIPGSNFLGMAARNYTKYQDSFNVFHSGKVRFGDATILKNGKATYKMPLSLFHKKLESKTLYNHHLIENFKELGQLKQKRNGFITEDFEIVEIDYNYSQKSAYDKEHRRSKDSSMFGFEAIKNGTEWQFAIQYDENIVSEDIELLRNSIVGKQKIGKSKTAQYGLVEISENRNSLDKISQDEKLGNTVLYVNSRLALVDDNGNPTFDVSYICPGICIDYTKTQIRTSTFTPYNGARQTKDYERVCINKGSVIYVNNITSNQLDIIKNGVGNYLSEGFGEILINPSFLILAKKEISLDKTDNDNNKTDKMMTIDKKFSNNTVQFLVNRHNKKIKKLELENSVSDFVQKYKTTYSKTKPSQWGHIRSICSSNFVTPIVEIRDYIESGICKWNQQQINSLLDNSIEFIKLVSMLMPKENSRGDKK